MASPHSGYPHHGPNPPSYYQPSPPPPHHVYGNHSPAPPHSPNPYPYLYPSHIPPPHMNSHLHHQPTSARANGRNGSYPNRNGHTHPPHMYHQNFHPPQPQSYSPHPLALHPHPQHPHSPHPVKYPHHYTPSYPPYPSPTAAAPYSPSWQTQQPLSPLPKQVSMPPPRGISPAYYEHPPAPPPQIHQPPTAAPSGSSSAALRIRPSVQAPTMVTQSPDSTESEGDPIKPLDVPNTEERTQEEGPTESVEQVEERTSTLVADNVEVVEPSEQEPSSPAQIVSSSYTTMGSISNDTAINDDPPNSSAQSPSSTKSSKAQVLNPVPSYAVWSRRPDDPTRAPGIIISPKACPPSDIIKLAFDTTTPPVSPKVVAAPWTPATEPEEVVEGSSIVDVQAKEVTGQSSPESQIPSTVSSSSVTDATDTPTLPGSPISTNTSVSLTRTPSKQPTVTVTVEDKVPELTGKTPTPDSATPVASTSKTPEPEPEVPKPAGPPKSWASLFSASSSASRSSLPKSSVVGFSIPAASVTSPTPSIPVPASRKGELLSLLTTGPTPGGAMPIIRTRGLINSGNMCFANAVLQVLVYCQPFQKLFTEVGKLMNKGGEKKGEREVKHGVPKSNTPFIDATVEFLKEFEERKGEKKGGKGKEKEIEGEEDEWPESFLPSYVYDAMKEKKRFESMRGGQQEDAEEFFGFYLDTLEEELLYIQNSLAPPSKSSASKPVEEKEEAAPPEEDGWLEVGKRNRTVVTRTIKAVESPITRIFGGKFRSTLRAPGQKDSVIVEDWRSLRLDIQREQTRNIQDALAHITDPQPVQVTHPSRPGITIDAHQKVLIDSLPPVLVLHMKRFCYDTAVGGVVKVTKQVKFNPELEIGLDMMTPARRTPATKYKLFAAIYHHGHSASGGHYTLDVLHPNRYPGTKIKEGWVRIDDELVSDVIPEDVFDAWEKDETRNAYLLFYKRMR